MTLHEEILVLVDRINAEATAIKRLPLAEELRRLLAQEKTQVPPKTIKASK